MEKDPNIDLTSFKADHAICDANPYGKISQTFI